MKWAYLLEILITHNFSWGVLTGEGVPWSIHQHVPEPGLFPLCLLEDCEGRIWLGTEGDGLWVYDDYLWRRVPGVTEARVDQILSLAQKGGRHIWAGLANDGLAEWDGKTWRHYKSREGFVGRRVFCVRVSSQGELWAATECGVSLLKAGNFVNESAQSGLPAGEVTAIAPDGPQNKTWAGTAENGLYARIADGKWERKKFPGWPDNLLVNDLLMDRNGRLWVATSLGLGRVTSDGSGKWWPGDPSPPNQLLGIVFLRLAEDSTGNIWVTTRTHGIWIVERQNEDLKYAGFNQASDFCYTILVDRQWNLWVGQYGVGLSVFRKYPYVLGWAWNKDWLVWKDTRLIALDEGGGVLWSARPQHLQESTAWAVSGLFFSAEMEPIMEFRSNSISGQDGICKWIRLSSLDGTVIESDEMSIEESQYAEALRRERPSPLPEHIRSRVLNEGPWLSEDPATTED